MSTPAEIAKEKGNDAFKKKDFTAARDHYANAMLLDPSDFRFPLNKSMANLRLERWQEAEEDATAALVLAPGELKAYFRRSTARKELRNFTGAQQDIKAFASGGGDPTLARNRSAELEVALVSTATGATSAHGFTIAESLEKDLGAFASQPYRRGDLILAERPLYTVRNPDNGGPTHRSNIVAAVRDLPKHEKQQFLSLKNAHAGSPRFANAILGTHATNAFSIGDDESAICLVASRFNHSCSPNARYSWHASSGRLRIFCLRNIEIGEEVCVSYISGRNAYGNPCHDRQRRLRTYGFTCACIVCTLPSAEKTASDARRTEINKIWESVPHFGPNQTTGRLRAIVRAIHLLEEEGYAADADDFTNDAAGICTCYSDWESVKYWATKT